MYIPHASCKARSRDCLSLQPLRDTCIYMYIQIYIDIHVCIYIYNHMYVYSTRIVQDKNTWVSLWMCSTRQAHDGARRKSHQHTATHHSTLQHTATHRNTLQQHTATHSNILQQHTATHRNTPHMCVTHHECTDLSVDVYLLLLLHPNSMLNLQSALGRLLHVL